MPSYAAALQALRLRLGIPSLKQLAAQPGRKMLYRVVAYYLDGRARNSVATCSTQVGLDDATLEVIYEGVNQHQPVQHIISADYVAALTQAFIRAHFDKLDDQTITASRLHTLWMIERAAGTFYHTLLLTPQQPEPPYSQIVNALDAYLPEAIREVLL